jgi:AcrR family transcriptional regulator
VEQFWETKSVIKVLDETTVSWSTRFMAEALARREELLEKIVEVFLAEGIANLSLRPLSDKVGSSARLLIYHFGSKEQLTAVALECVRARITKAVGELIAVRHAESLDDFLRVFWKWAVEETNQRYFRLLFEIDGLSMHEINMVPMHDRIAGATGWVKLFEKRVDKLAESAADRSAASTLIIAAINGLLHDYFATGDLERTSAAIEFLIEMLRNQAASLQRPDR